MRKKLKKSFFERETEIVAEDLIGKFLVRRYRGKEISQMITETEAYDGPFDKASHAHKGETNRTKVMFDEAGNWYVYLVYGMYWMLNVVTGPKTYPAAVLIRGTKETTGPGRLTKAFKADKQFNHKNALGKENLWIEDRGIKIKPSQISKTKRIGVDYAGPYWSNKEYRFVLEK